MFSDTGKCLGKIDNNIFDHLSVLFYLDFFKHKIINFEQTFLVLYNSHLYSIATHLYLLISFC